MSAESWRPAAGSAPTAPMNLQVMSPYVVGALDLRWDDPRLNVCNSQFDVVGVNIYRSTASERGPYTRVNRFPIGGSFYRDQTDNLLVENEIVDWNTSWCNRGKASNSNLWKFQTRRRPIVQRGGQAIAADSPRDVQLTINGVTVPVHEVFGPTGEVTLINMPTYDVARQKMLPPVLPDENSVVTITYHTNRNLVDTSLDKKLWYRVTTVASCVDQNGVPLTPSGFVETPLNQAPAVSPYQIETMDYIWREAVRRNNFMLEQGGERAHVMIQKTSGVPCNHGRDPRLIEVGEQPVNRCPSCFGTGFVGGYEGPYSIIVSPDDAERKIAQYARGRQLEHQWDIWVGPSPMLSQRDFIIRQTNERYAIGAIRKPSVRGNVLQQHFMASYLDEQDIRYQVPMPDPGSLAWPHIRDLPATLQGGAWRDMGQGSHPVGPDLTTPHATEKESVPNSREIRGRTSVWENIST